MKRSTKRRFALASMILLHTLTTTLDAQWVQTNGPYGGTIRALAVSGGNVFAGTSAGVFRSTNNGTTWTKASNGLAVLDVLSLGVSGSDLYAGTSNGMFHSTDAGANWTDVSSGIAYPYVRYIVMNGSSIFVGTYGGVFLSTNGGSSWISRTAGMTDSVNLPYLGINHLGGYANGTGGQNLLASTTYGYVQSTNGGASWGPVGTGLDGVTLNSIMSAGNSAYAGGLGTVFRSTNYGSSWTPVTTGLASGQTIIALVSASNGSGGTNLFAGSTKGVYRSTDDGSTWTAVNSGLTDQYVSALLAAPNGSGGSHIFAGTQHGGAFLSANSGTSWTQVISGMTNSYVNCSLASGSMVFTGTMYDGVFLSTNGGTSWTPMNSGVTNSTVYGLAYLPNGTGGANLFAATGGIPPAGTPWGGIFRSTTNGSSWAQMTTYEYVFSLASMPTGSGGAYLFAATSGGVRLSTNYGTTWNTVATGLSNKNTYAVAAFGTTLFTGTYGGAIYRSTNAGTSWTKVDSIVTSTNIFAFDMITTVAGDTTLFAASDGGGVYRSTNKGSSWSQVNAGLLNLKVWDLLTIPTGGGGTDLFAATDSGVYRSGNKGDIWSSVSTGLVTPSVRTLSLTGTDLYAGTATGGMWRRPLSQMTTDVEPTAPAVPLTVHLTQNYPNPFNPSTVIKYQMPVVRGVDLRVFDLLGREVAVLVNEEKSPGTYSVTWNAGGMASGIYFYQLRAGGETITNRMILLR